jgi:hypothetical protein
MIVNSIVTKTVTLANQKGGQNITDGKATALWRIL